MMNPFEGMSPGELLWLLFQFIAPYVLLLLITFAVFKVALRIRARISPEISYADRVSELAISLTDSADKVDSLMREIAEVAVARQGTLQKLQQEIMDLAQRESELKNRIGNLSAVPIPVAEHFAKLLEPGERRSARRDYLLFALGVIAGGVVSILLKLFGWG